MGVWGAPPPDPPTAVQCWATLALPKPNSWTRRSWGCRLRSRYRPQLLTNDLRVESLSDIAP